MSIQLFNDIGQLVKAEEAKDGESTIHLTGLSEGMYFVNVLLDNNQVARQKIIITK